jgi:diaminohydroxyphosphoribosylaminopyrimidine deaminase/5-amino-6-(5-phosphoribosylamino)uracil reductase
MERALALARRGVGRTSPNPAVGAVVVKAGQIVGEGWHRQAGGSHAEVFALRGGGTRGATLYVTLEPCCTHGRTPPCTEAIIAAGIRRVVVAARDPNPRHAGRGLTILRRAGINVSEGLLAEEAREMNAGFNQWITTGRPLVIAKVGMSLDGRIATRTGDSRWITSVKARRLVHQMRARVDAVMVSAGTVVADDPRLTLRHGVRGRQPWRVVVDGQGRSPRRAKLFTDCWRQRTIVVTTELSRAAWRRYLALLGITVLVVRREGTHVAMPALVRALGAMEITSVLVEGGGGLLGALLDAGLVDRVVLFYAPKLIGGIEGKLAFEGRGVAKLREAFQYAGRWRDLGDGEALFEGCRR